MKPWWRRALPPLSILLTLALLVLGADRALVPVQLGGTPSTVQPGTTNADPVEGTAPVSAAVLACPGPEQQGLVDATVPEQPQTVTVRAVSAPTEVLGETGGGSSSDPGRLGLLPTGGGAVQDPSTTREHPVSIDIEDAEGVLVQASGTLAPGLAAAQHHRSDKEQSRGLQLTPCVPAREESWLLGGGGQVGRIERLVLVNPGADAVSATVQVLGAETSSEAGEGEGVVVPARGRVVVLVDALAPGAVAPAVRVSTEGGPVAAFLGDRWLSGSTDRGLELTTPAAAPATRQVVPGVVVAAGEGADTRLRVAVPGADQAVVQVRALTLQGRARLQQDVTLVRGGSTQDIQLGDLPPGRFALQVTSDVPVVVAAAMRTAPGPDGATGLGWAPATMPLTGLAGLPLPESEAPGQLATLHLASPDSAQAEVTVVSADGSVRTERVALAAGGAAAEVDLGEADSVWVRAVSGQVHAAVVLEGADRAGEILAVAALEGMPLHRPTTSVSPLLP